MGVTGPEAVSAALAAALPAAVPLWIDRMRGDSPEERRARGLRCSAVITAHGDDVLYRSREPGGSAAAFNALAEALAVLSYAPGGVMLAGMAWCAAHPAVPARRWVGRICPSCLAEERPGPEEPGEPARATTTVTTTGDLL